MKKLKYILAIILILAFSAVLSWAEESKASKDEKTDEDQTETVDEALDQVESLLGGESPDVIQLGQMMKDGLLNPVRSKAKRDNPFDPPIEEPSYKTRSSSEIGPLPPPPFVGPEGPVEITEIKVPDRIAEGINLVGIMEVGESKIAILTFGGITKSLKVGQALAGPINLVVKEIGSDGVILSTKDGTRNEWVGFSFASKEL